MNGELQIIGIIIQSGSVGISLVLIWFINEKEKRNQIERNENRNVIENHLTNSVKAIKDNTKSNLKIVKVLQKMTDKLEDIR